MKNGSRNPIRSTCTVSWFTVSTCAKYHLAYWLSTAVFCSTGVDSWENISDRIRLLHNMIDDTLKDIKKDGFCVSMYTREYPTYPPVPQRVIHLYFRFCHRNAKWFLQLLLSLSKCSVIVSKFDIGINGI